MSGESSAFHLLDERIQRYIWSEGWTELRDAQEMAIPVILPGDRDAIVAAATAAGKTEAAFLPILTRMVQDPDDAALVVYVSPLKALINDQFGRLDRLCELLDIPVWPWHGDISSSSKAKFLKRPKGVLLITPESLEALLCNRGTSMGFVFQSLMYVVVDELHAFIGSERGKQLQALLHRIEILIGRDVPRIGLSATLGDMSLAGEFLRPGHGTDVRLVCSKDSAAELRFRLKGFEESSLDPAMKATDDHEAQSPRLIAKELFRVLRGSNNLVFPNSRRGVEQFTHLLNEECESNFVPTEFWPHHGSLSKEIRSETEAALKQKERPATAICTNTLELGIDIGAVKSVVQIGPPPSVASLRQRLGRSGRRKGEPAILRGYTVEDEIHPKSSIVSRLRLPTVEFTAKCRLLLERWFEPPVTTGMHLSTLIQQLLSMIAQYGGLQAGEAYRLLCSQQAPFSCVSADDFKSLLRHLGALDVLMQDSSGLLLHAPVGERIVNHYSFYAAFATDEEFRIETAGRSLGSLPVSQMLAVGQRILFAGKTWLVQEIHQREKVIVVARAKGGVPPVFSGGGGSVHSRVRQRMRELLETSSQESYLDETAQRFLDEARNEYARLELSKVVLLDQGDDILMMTWMGDAVNEALSCMLRTEGFLATPAGPGVEVQPGRRRLGELETALKALVSKPVPEVDVLLEGVDNLCREKWDDLLPEGLLRKGYASRYLDLPEAAKWLKTFADGESVLGEMVSGKL